MKTVMLPDNIIIITILVTCIVIGLCGNLAVLVIRISKQRLRTQRTIHSYLVCHLATADTLYSATLIFDLHTKFNENKWVLGPNACKFSEILQSSIWTRQYYFSQSCLMNGTLELVYHSLTDGHIKKLHYCDNNLGLCAFISYPSLFGSGSAKWNGPLLRLRLYATTIHKRIHYILANNKLSNTSSFDYNLP